ncbi:MAG: hypothetical protein IJA10_11155 [Lachnospiraceae bacterium]|nr:hypothetical protein [Lachnospiraceae bacterium]
MEMSFTVSKHAKERYAERIMNKEDLWDVNYFVNQNEEKIIKDITKMLEYGEVIYSGKQKDNKGRENTVDVYRKDCWILLVDKCTKNVITLYKVDLGCGDDFNAEYVNRMIEKIHVAMDNVSKVQMDILNESNMYREMITKNNDQIAEYRTYIKNLEALNESYKQIIDNNVVKNSQANKELAEHVNTLIGKKEF